MSTEEASVPTRTDGAEPVYLARPYTPIRVAMGPIIGAILIANLISGIIGAIAYSALR